MSSSFIRALSLDFLDEVLKLLILMNQRVDLCHELLKFSVSRLHLVVKSCLKLLNLSLLSSHRNLVISLLSAILLQMTNLIFLRHLELTSLYLELFAHLCVLGLITCVVLSECSQLHFHGLQSFLQLGLLLI